MANTPWMDLRSGVGRFISLLSGQFSSTVKDSQDVNGIDVGSADLEYDGTNVVWAGFNADKLYLHSGLITSTLKTSQTIGTVDTLPRGASSDSNGDTPWLGLQATRLYLQSGQFTSTIKTSQDLPGGVTNAWGPSFDGTNTPWSNITDKKLMLTSGEFTSTIKDSEDVSGLTSLGPAGISWDGTDTPWTEDTATRKLYLQSGQFTSTVKTSIALSTIGAAHTQAFGISVSEGRLPAGEILQIATVDWSNVSQLAGTAEASIDQVAGVTAN